MVFIFVTYIAQTSEEVKFKFTQGPYRLSDHCFAFLQFFWTVLLKTDIFFSKLNPILRLEIEIDIL